jgi:hypothetical protein
MLSLLLGKVRPSRSPSASGLCQQAQPAPTGATRPGADSGGATQSRSLSSSRYGIRRDPTVRCRTSSASKDH